VFGPDRQSHCVYTFREAPWAVGTTELSERWYIRDGNIIFDREHSAIRSTLWAMFPKLGILYGDGYYVTLVSLTDDELVVMMRPGGTRQVWTRVPAD
jgi:hypothetical protein